MLRRGTGSNSPFLLFPSVPRLVLPWLGPERARNSMVVASGFDDAPLIRIKRDAVPTRWSNHRVENTWS